MSIKIKLSCLALSFAILVSLEAYAGNSGNTSPQGMPTLGEVSSNFDDAKDIKGILIDAKYGVPVISSADGIIRMSGEDDRYGTYVSVYHQNGYMTYYLFLQDVKVNNGDRVKRGETIGYTGKRNDGKYGIVYKVSENGTFINPVPFIQNIEEN